MLTTMVAGPGPAFCENGARNQVTEVVPTSPSGQLSPSPTQCNNNNANHLSESSSMSSEPLEPSVEGSSDCGSSLPEEPPAASPTDAGCVVATGGPVVQSSNSSTPNRVPLSNGTNMVAMVPSEVQLCPPPEFTPPPTMAPAQYCSQEFIPGEVYFPGPPGPEFAQHHMCTVHHGVPGTEPRFF